MNCVLYILIINSHSSSSLRVLPFSMYVITVHEQCTKSELWITYWLL